MPGFVFRRSTRRHRQTLAMRRFDSRQEAEKFREGLEHFNRGRFFEAHESWEEIWLPAAEPEKTFLQGIIQVAAAFHHHQRGNRAGTKSLLRAGLKKLERFPSQHRGIQLEKLRAAARRWLGALTAHAEPVHPKIPRIAHTKPRHAGQKSKLRAS
jgi:predicted metal-dependent hydrolase